jgi:translation initiation factor 2-alpha kinase 4
MPPPSPWGKKPQQRNATSSGFPDLKPSKSNDAVPTSPGPKSQYEEIQEDELIALASIYGEDFRKIETNLGAWKVWRFSQSPHLKRDN